MKQGLILAAVLALIGAPQIASAQSLSLSTKNAKSPITVTAQDGLEWQQDNKIFIAHGDAKAVQDDITVTADELVAHYRSKPKDEPGAKSGAKTIKTNSNSNSGGGGDDDTGSEVYRVDALGHVKITSKDDVATGEAAVYDFDRKVLVLNGHTLKLTTKDGVVTSDRTLQYWSDQDVAVAEGNALAVDTNPDNGGRSLKGDKLVAFFRDSSDPNKPPQNSDANKKSKPVKVKANNGSADSNKKDHDLIYLQAFGNAVLTTATEVIKGDRGNYNLDTGMATVEDNVKMTRDKNQMNGGYAVVNVNSGVSNLYSNIAQAKGLGAPPPPRVRALLIPNNTAIQDPPLPVPPAAKGTPAKGQKTAPNAKDQPATPVGKDK